MILQIKKHTAANIDVSEQPECTACTEVIASLLQYKKAVAGSHPSQATFIFY